MNGQTEIDGGKRVPNPEITLSLEEKRVIIPALTETFYSSAFFRENTDPWKKNKGAEKGEIMFSHINPEFSQFFGHMVVSRRGEQVLSKHKLTKAVPWNGCYDKNIRAKFQPDHVIDIAGFGQLLELQPNLGEDGYLSTENGSNAFYIPDRDGIVRVVCLYKHGKISWGIKAFYPDKTYWDTGVHFFEKTAQK